MDTSIILVHCGRVSTATLALMLVVAGCTQPAVAISPGPNDAEQGTQSAATISLVPNEAEQRVDVLVDGQPFTSYIYSDKISVLKKPVLYPLRTAKGTLITRGFPLDPTPGERVDHPHHIGVWLNHGNVSGFDFWNNSDAIPEERLSGMGTIRHRTINPSEKSNELSVTADWLGPDGKAILREDTRFIFHAASDSRSIDRITTLTALDEKVDCMDSKEGMLGIRVTRALEHPSRRPVTLTDAKGLATDVRVMDNTGVTGNYLSSEGIEGEDVWGKRATWVVLRAQIKDESLGLAIFDHPENVGYPTYWHARGYGLFAANPLGQKDFTEGEEELNFSLPAGQSTTFRYRVGIYSGEITADRMNAAYQEFAAQEFVVQTP